MARTKAAVFIIKYWGAQILKIIEEVHKLGSILLLLRPENVYVSKDGQKVRLASVKGSGRINDFGKVQMAPDFYINLHDPEYVPNPEQPSARSLSGLNSSIQNDPYLAPEMIFSVSVMVYYCALSL